MRRDAFIGRLRAALGRRAGDPVAAPPDLSAQPGRLCGPDDERVARFVGAAEAVGVEVRVIAQAALEATVASLVNEGDAVAEHVVCAVAGTGSLVVHAGPGTPRSMSLRPRRWVAVVPASRIAADLWDYLGALDPGEPAPSARVIITGPSKTADIEGVLITGVHGPERVVAVVVSDA